MNPILRFTLLKKEFAFSWGPKVAVIVNGLCLRNGFFGVHEWLLAKFLSLREHWFLSLSSRQ